MPFNVACGFCKNCSAGYTGFCLTVNPGFAGGAYGYVAMGPGSGRPGRLPTRPLRGLQLPKLPAGHRARDRLRPARRHLPHWLPRLRTRRGPPGESVAVYGGGPVGLMAAYSALLRGARRSSSSTESRAAAKAEEIGAVPINFAEGNPVEQIKEQTGGAGTDKGIDAVGYQAHAARAGGEEPATCSTRSSRRCARPARSASRALRTGRSGRPGRAGQARHAPRRDRQALREGPAHGHGAVQRQALQPPAARPDHRGPCEAELRCLT